MRLSISMKFAGCYAQVSIDELISQGVSVGRASLATATLFTNKATHSRISCTAHFTVSHT